MAEYLAHHGILGMKWGVRRYQNADGSLTPAGRKRLEAKDKKWATKNYDKITNQTKKKVSRELDAYGRKLLSDKSSYKANGKISSAAVNAYNRRMAELMNQAAKDLRSPSGQVVQFVAKRGELGVHMALATPNYDMSQLKNGVWASGRIAYKKKSVEMAHGMDYLAHYGVKGMKWGVRRTPEQLGHKPTVAKTDKSGIIKTTITGHKPAPMTGTPNSVVDHVARDGGVDSRSYYDKDGYKIRDVHTTSHKNPKQHAYGANGEHAHDYYWDEKGILKGRSVRELTSEERKENKDIL